MPDQQMEMLHCDTETVPVVDGRHDVLQEAVHSQYCFLLETLGRAPSEYELARSAWEVFRITENIEDGRRHFDDALEIARDFLSRIEERSIDIRAEPTTASTISVESPILSALDAKNKLKQSIAGFLEYRAHEREPSVVRHLFVRSPAGLGKTTSTIDLAVAYSVDRHRDDLLRIRLDDADQHFNPSMLVYVRTHSLGSEIQRLIQDSFWNHEQVEQLPIWRGRTHDLANNNAPCRLGREAQRLQDAGISVGPNLCQRYDPGQHVWYECRYFRTCEYIDTRRIFAPFTILMTAQLGQAGPGGLYWRHDGDVEEGDVDTGPTRPPGYTGFFRPTVDGDTFLIDETPVEYLVKDFEFTNADLDRIRDGSVAQAIRENGASGIGTLTSLRNQGITPQHLRRLASNLSDEERRQGNVATPGHLNESDETDVLGTIRLPKLSGVLERLATELATGRGGEAYSIRKAGNNYRAKWRESFPLLKMPGIILDATGDPVILRQFVPNLELEADIKVERKARITQITDKTFSRYSLFEDQGAPELRSDVLRLIKKIARDTASRSEGARTLVVTYKKFRKALTQEEGDDLSPSATIPDTTIDVAHFGGIRGLDQFKDHQAIVIIGRQQPSPRNLEDLGRAIWYDDPNAIETVAEGERLPERPDVYRVKELGDLPTRGRGVAYHPDPRIHALLRQIREAETLQAIDRLRLIHNEIPKEVYILSNIPLPDLTIDRLINWEDCRRRGTKLERVLAKCDRHEYRVAILRPDWLARKFPQLWGSASAAKSWLDRKPLKDNRSYSYWGDLCEFRIQGQRGRASRALVKRDLENPAVEITRLIDGEAIDARRVDWPTI